MSSGTGVGVLDDVINVTTQLATGGLVGYGEEGVGAGVTGEAAIDATKEVTGAAAAEEANQVARQQMEMAREQREQDRENAQADQRNRQISASRAAGAARRTTTSRGTSSSRAGGMSLDPETDFLGL